MKYLRIKNWKLYQAKDRNKRQIKRYIYDYSDKDHDYEYSQLTAYQRYVWDACCRLRGRFGRNLHNDATWIARAIHMLPTDRPHMRYAIDTLIAHGFLVPCNEEVTLSDSDSDSDTDPDLEAFDLPTDLPTNKPSATPQAPLSEQAGEDQNLDWVQDVKDIFPHAGALGPAHKKMWFEILAQLDRVLPDQFIVAGVPKPKPDLAGFCITMIIWNMDHFPDSGKRAGMRIRSLRGLHNAVMKADPDTGIIMQALYHDKESCKPCLARLKAAEKQRDKDMKAPAHLRPEGYWSIGEDSVCCDCRRKGINVPGKPRCQSCIDKFREESA